MTASQFQSALTHYRADRLRDAEAELRLILNAEPLNFDANHLLGMVQLQTGRPAEAVETLSAAAAAKPSVPELQSNLGNALRSIGRVDEAIAAFQRAVRLRPDYFLAHNNLGAALRSKGDLAGAANSCRSALRYKPDFFEAWANLGHVLENSGDLSGAEQAYRKAISLRPGAADAHCGLGGVHQAAERLDEAIKCYQAALRINPSHLNSLINLASVLKRQGQVDRAIELLDKAIAINPRSVEALELLAGSLWAGAYVEKSLACYQRAIQLSPVPRLRILAAMLVPAIYRTVEEVRFWRERLVREVGKLKAERVVLDLSRQLPRTSTYLPYQGLDDASIQRDIGSLYGVPVEAPPIGSGQNKIRVGFISALFRDQTVGLWMQGLIARLPRDRFEVVVLSIGSHSGKTNEFIRSHCDRYVEVPVALPAARETIRQCRLDILLYADLGMEPITYALAVSRLAPVQCVTWGHPITSGLWTIDYFISSELAEAPDGQRHYTEKLVALAHLPLYYYRPEPPQKQRDRQYFNLPAGAHLYGCLQSLMKMHPDFDAALAGVLDADPAALILIPQGVLRGWDQIVLDRWKQILPGGLDRIHFLPRMDRDEFRSLTALCDLMLAPFPFGAGDTSLEAFSLGIPVVTLPTPQLKGRLTLAMYKLMGIHDCIARDVPNYVELAVRLGTDERYRDELRQRILSAAGVLFENPAGVEELADFFQSVAGKNSPD